MREVKIKRENNNRIPETSSQCDAMMREDCVGCIMIEFVLADTSCQYRLMLHAHSEYVVPNDTHIKQYKTLYIPETIDECTELGCGRCAIHPQMLPTERCQYRKTLNLLMKTTVKEDESQQRTP